MKKLRRWLFNNNITIRALAEGIGVAPGHLRAVLSNSQAHWMSLDMAQKIENFTYGKIRVSDIYKEKRAKAARAYVRNRYKRNRVKQLDFEDVVEATPKLPENWGNVHGKPF
jgi:hypothetical protein